jgi:hypothetical protein
MGALSKNKDVPRKAGELESFLVEDNVHIFKGALVSVNSSGYLIPAGDTATTKCKGVAYEECDNTLVGHTQGGKSCRVYCKGVFKLVASSIDQSMIGSIMYVIDDQTVDNTSAQLIPAGILVECESNTVGWIDVGALREGVTANVTLELAVAPVDRAVESAGWVQNISGLSMAKNITGKKVYVPIEGLVVGDVITKMHMAGGIGASVAGATILDWKLCKVVGAAGGDTDSDIQAGDQLSKTADYLVNEEKAVAAPSTVATDSAYYFCLTGTTFDDNTNDIVIIALSLEVTRTRAI